MTVAVKSKDEFVVPRAVQRRAGIKVGQRVRSSIIPDLPSDDEYTPAQRRLIDARLAEARKGPYYRRFETADETIKLLHKEIRNRSHE